MTKRIFPAIVSGAVLVLTLAPFDLSFLAWAGLVPLLYALDGAGHRRRFLLGLVAGFVFFLGTVYWVVNSMHFYGGLGLSSSIPVMLLLVFYLSLYPALFGLLSGLVQQRTARLFYLPFLWVAIEYLRGWLFTGFPWAFLGYSLVNARHLVQTADITGVWGLSFMVVLVNACIFIVIKKRRPFLKEALFTAVIISSAFLYGMVRIEKIEKAVSEWKTIKVALAQGNIDQSLKWDKSFRKKTLAIYSTLTRRAAALGSELVIWPETAVPFYLERNRETKRKVTSIAEKEKVWLLTGSPAFDYNPKEGGVRLFNSAYLIDPAGMIRGRYDKVHLVPYGEYVPLKRFFPFIKKLTEGTGDFSAGPPPKPLRGEGISPGVVICYEAVFPDLTRRLVERGTDILVNITNDAWFGRTSAPYQHFEMARLRAVENRIFLLRAANTGISAVVDPAGRAVVKSEIFSEALIVRTAGIKRNLKTFYTRYGDLAAYVSLIGAAAIFGAEAAARKRRKSDVR